MAHLLDLDEDALEALGAVYAERWSRTDDLLASIFDAIQALTWHTRRAPYLGEQGVKALNKERPPSPLARPGQELARRRGTTIGELMAMEGVTGG